MFFNSITEASMVLPLSEKNDYSYEFCSDINSALCIYSKKSYQSISLLSTRGRHMYIDFASRFFFRTLYLHMF